MVRLTCTVPGCTHGDEGGPYKSEDLENQTALEMLKMHRSDCHAGTLQPQPTNTQAEPRGSGPRGKIDMPTLSAHCSSDQWEDFLYDWKNYKTAMSITETVASAYLYGCLEEELRRDLRKSNPTVVASEMAEQDLLRAVKRLTVKVESVLAHRIKLGKAVQAPGQGIRTFHAQLKGLASACDYSVVFTCSCATVKKVDYSESVIQDQLIRGLADQEILAELLGDEKTDRTLDQIVGFIARKEQAKQEQGVVTTGSSNAAVHQPNGNRSCRQCLGKDHGSRAQRLKECPAKEVTCDRCNVKGHFSKACIKCADCSEWGHKSKKSKRCTQEKPEQTDMASRDTGTMNIISLGAVANNSKVVGAEVEKKPISHHIFTDGIWKARPPQSHPKVEAELSPGLEDHDALGYPVPPGMKLKSFIDTVICDTGCMSTAIPLAVAHRLGFKKKTLIPVSTCMNGAGKNDLGVIGALVMHVKLGGSSRSTRQLSYVCTEIDCIYISRQGLQELGLIDKDFPNVVRGTAHVAALKNTQCDCTCPERPSTIPERITSVPEYARGNTELLKEFLLKHYESTVFNTCECQKLPKLTGPPLKLQVDPNAEPVACHKIQPIPVHWQDKVHNDLQRDVAIGVLDRVPKNTPTTWLSKMVIAAKANGDPRRTVDFQQLNKHIKRQTFPLETPWQLASKIPGNSLKTVVDNWNGYHSVPLDEQSKDYTQFLTPWGRYRYASAGQGCLVSGDAFNERMYEIFEHFPNKVRCVDDSGIWTSGMDVNKHFLSVAEYLHICAENGIVLNPKKLQFCQTEVEFAGFTVGLNCIKPCVKILEAIRGFPTPTDISGVRAWFGLVNQVSYAFAMTEHMSAFRHLLSPKTPFIWDEKLEEEFQRSKEHIIQKVSEGVRTFDPKLRTAIATDFSKKGIGFMLLQKTCNCNSNIPNCCPGGWKTILIGSRFLHDAEERYAPIEGECLAVVYGLRKCRYFVLGCRDLIVVTDHKPLLGVLNDRSLADMDNKRLLLLKEKTLEFQFQIVHVPGRLHVGPDSMSRNPVPKPNANVATISSNSSAPMTVDIRRSIYQHLAVIEVEDPELLVAQQFDAVSELNEKHSYGCCSCENADAAPVNVVTWQMIQEASAADEEIQLLKLHIADGTLSNTDGRKVHPKIKPYLKYGSSIYEISDGIVMLGERVIVPTSLRQKVLHLLHAAHQGVDRMKGRASGAVYWPGIVADIEKERAACTACHKMAKSNPSLPPYPPPEPEYPFQYIAADYFTFRGKDYCVVVDRFSHWPEIFMSQQGGSKRFVSCLRSMFSTFGVSEEISTDGASVFKGGLTQSFLRDWGVKHRLSSVANAHSNCRAEIAVKQAKRLLTDNIDDSGQLDRDAFHRALLSYRNTPDQFTKVSPAKLVFGREVRDGVPMIPGKYSPHEAWKEALDAREKALAKRQVLGHEKWSEHTKNLPALKKGDTVYVQNTVGNHPRRWERSGTVVECGDYDQYNVKMDGSNRCTLRNRKHLRKFTPPIRQAVDIPFTPTEIVEQPLQDPEVPQPTDRHVGDEVIPVLPSTQVPQHQSEVVTPPQMHLQTSPSVLQGDIPVAPAIPQNSSGEGSQVRRSQRTKLPSTLLNPETWDLGSIAVDRDQQNIILLHHLKTVLDLLAAQITCQHRGGGDK